MKTILLSLVIFVSIGNCIAQKHDYNWLMGGACNPTEDFLLANLDFNDNELIADLLPPIRFFFNDTNSSISDIDGNLMFYTNGNDVFNWKHELMENGANLANLGDCDEQNLQQGAISIPFPGQKDQYVLITINEDFFLIDDEVAVNQKVYFNHIDMTKNNGEGQLVVRQDLIIEDTLNAGQGMVCQHANGRDWWLLMFEFDSNEYYKFLIDPTGVQLIGKEFVSLPVIAGRGQIAYSSEGDYLAHFNSTGVDVGTYIDIFNFDRCLGLLSNQVQFLFNDEVPLGEGGLAFSPNSRFLYVSNLTFVYQYDLWATDIESSRITVAEYDGFIEDNFWRSTFHMAQMAPDNKIYITTGTDGHYLHVIHNPNEKGLACNLEQHALEWPTWKHISIPNFPHYRMGALEGSLCDTLGVEGTSPSANFVYEINEGSPLQFTFDDLSFNGPESWLWDFGDGNVSTLENPMHSYDNFGGYQVCLTVSNEFGSDIFCQNVCALPEVETTSFISSSSMDLDCADLNQEIDLSSRLEELEFVNIENWIANWERPDGLNIQDAMDISVNQSGTYYLTLQDTMFGCSISDSIVIGENNFALEFELSQDFAALDCNEFVDIELEIDVECFEVRWQRPNGNISTTFNTTSFNLTTAGIYTFFVSECNSDCETMHTLVIERVPVSALWEAEIVGRTVSFVPEVTGPFYVNIWHFGDGNIGGGENPIHTYESAGTYEVEHEIFDGCEWYSDIKELVVEEDLVEAPVADFSITNLDVQLRLSHQFEDLSNGEIEEWFWDFGDGDTSTDQNPMHTYEELGSYQVCLSVTNSAGTNTSCQVICAYPNPVDVPYISSARNTLGCDEQGVIELSANIGFIPIDSFEHWGIEWIGPNGFSVIGSSSIEVEEVGGYSLMLTDTIFGCEIFDTKYIDADFSIPLFTLHTSSFVLPCEESIDLSVEIEDSECYTITWLDENLNELSDTTEILAVTESGVYIAMVLDCESGCGSSQEIFIEDETIDAGWEEEVMNATYQFTSIEEKEVNHLWDFGDTNSSTEASPIHTYTETGVYTVTHIVSNACGADTLSATIEVIITSTNSVQEAGLEIFPNPTKDYLTIQSEEKEIAQIDIYSSLGQKVLSQNDLSRGMNIDVSHFVAGVYWVSVRMRDGGVLNEKIIVE